MSSPSKSCSLDPAPTFLVKEYIDTLVPFLNRLVNASLSEGCLPTSQTTAVVTPVLKKTGLDPGDIKNYRPISNLTFLSKVTEKVVAQQVLAYLNSRIFFQSSSRVFVVSILQNLRSFVSSRMSTRLLKAIWSRC